MTSQILPFGTESATHLHPLSDVDASDVQPPRTLSDLLFLWTLQPPSQHAMLRTTCARLADYFNEPVENISLDLVERDKKGFRPFLETRKYGENSIRTYVNYVRILLIKAKAVGWVPGSAVTEPWRALVNLARTNKFFDLAYAMAAQSTHPEDVTVEAVDHWVREEAGLSRSYDSAVKQRSRFWRGLRDLGYRNKLPVSILREKRLGIRIDQFPTDLRIEVLELLKWKQAPYTWNRPKNARHRPPTAERLKTVISLLYGFAINVRQEIGISGLPQLLRQDIVGSYIEWCINERKVKGQTLQRNLRLVAAILNQHPSYCSIDQKWLKPLIESIPLEPESEVKKRKAEKYLDYAVLEGIPAKIHAERAKAGRKSRKRLALKVRDELLIRWLTVLPWRQRNIRECRIGGPSPNVFKGLVPPLSSVELPPWAAEAHRKDPNTQFWQFRFSEDETKTGCAVHALLPRQLIEPLEEYVNSFRDDLVLGGAPLALFLNQNGKALSLSKVTHLVSKLTLEYGGRRVTPHLFRDIVAYAWLKHHPKDYLTLSKHLWHASPNEVIKTYGSRFNESSGVCMMESWLDERNGGSGE